MENVKYYHGKKKLLNQVLFIGTFDTRKPNVFTDEYVFRMEFVIISKSRFID